MLLLWIGLAFPCDAEGAAQTIGASPDLDHYLCLARSPRGAAAIASTLPTADDQARPRLQRALTLWLLERSDEPFDAEKLSRLSAADRRLLEDGVYARRGRPSPAPEHAKVFTQLGYTPAPGYTDGRLRPVDRQNLQALRVLQGDGQPAPAPPPATVSPPPAPPPQAEPPPQADPEPAPAPAWGCATAPSSSAPATFFSLLLSLPLLARLRLGRPR